MRLLGNDVLQQLDYIYGQQKNLVIDEYENLHIISCTVVSMFLLMKRLTAIDN